MAGSNVEPANKWYLQTTKTTTKHKTKTNDKQIIKRKHTRIGEELPIVFR